ncbi:hypothetical protein H0H93_010868 [Arthromyces matolae]|nr:hypothetical protein H0H93_010868 [Arthromyces matolae]
MATLNDMLLQGDYSDLGDLMNLRTSILKKISDFDATITKRRARLGVDEEQNLKKLVHNKFLQVRVNALALKQRIRTKLCERKFELARLERAYRNTSSGEQKLHDHVASQVQRHEPGISGLCRKYNEACEDLQRRLEKGEGPPGAVAPLPIDKSGLFKLDVDDDIWQDVGLYDSDYLDLPRWLGDEDVRRGIKAMLELDRCIEEETRLDKEWVAMQRWFQEEWMVMEMAMEKNQENSNITYLLQLWRRRLLELCITWQRAVGRKNGEWNVSDVELQAVFEEMTVIKVMDGSDDEDFEDVEDEDNHADLWDAVEISELASSYREDTKEWEDVALKEIPQRTPASRSPSKARVKIYYPDEEGGSPKKRPRPLD